MRLSTNMMYQLSMQGILDRQSEASHIGQQMASQKRIVNPSDDPRAAARALVVSQADAVNEQLKSSRIDARRHLKAEANELGTVTDALVAAKPLLVRAGNGTLDSSNLVALAADLQGIYDQIEGSANARDGNGNYLFSGYDLNNPAFSGTQGNMTYNGSPDQQELKVGASRKMAVNDTGAAVFSDWTESAEYVGTAEGNSISGHDHNDGTAVLTNITTKDNTLVNYGGSFGIKFEEDGSGTLKYQLVDGNGNDFGGQHEYKSGEPIEVGNNTGMSLTFKGEPEDGDTFSLTREPKNNMLNTIAGVIDQLKNTDTSSAVDMAALHNVVNAAHRQLSNGLDNVLTVRSSLGARLNELDNLDDVGSNRSINYARTLSDLQDLDVTKAVSDFALTKVALEMSRKAFMQIQGLSLFNMQ